MLNQHLLLFQAESSLAFVTGAPAITVLEGQTGSYTVMATPQRRGKFSGVISFVAGKNPVM